jgi:hypothetical protein
MTRHFINPIYGCPRPFEITADNETASAIAVFAPGCSAFSPSQYSYAEVEWRTTFTTSEMFSSICEGPTTGTFHQLSNCRRKNPGDNGSQTRRAAFAFHEGRNSRLPAAIPRASRFRTKTHSMSNIIRLLSTATFLGNDLGRCQDLYGRANVSASPPSDDIDSLWISDRWSTRRSRSVPHFDFNKRSFTVCVFPMTTLLAIRGGPTTVPVVVDVVMEDFCLYSATTCVRLSPSLKTGHTCFRGHVTFGGFLAGARIAASSPGVRVFFCPFFSKTFQFLLRHSTGFMRSFRRHVDGGHNRSNVGGYSRLSRERSGVPCSCHHGEIVNSSAKASSPRPIGVPSTGRQLRRQFMVTPTRRGKPGAFQLVVPNCKAAHGWAASSFAVPKSRAVHGWAAYLFWPELLPASPVFLVLAKREKVQEPLCVRPLPTAMNWILHSGLLFQVRFGFIAPFANGVIPEFQPREARIGRNDGARSVGANCVTVESGQHRLFAWTQLKTSRPWMGGNAGPRMAHPMLPQVNG